MKKLLLYIIVCSCFVSCSKKNEPSKFDEPLVIAAHTWTPYVGYDLPGHGFFVELIQEAMSRAGIKTKVRDVEWSQALEQIKLGEIDILPGLWYTEERAKTIAYSSVIGESRLALISRSDRDEKIETIEDLDGLQVGVVQGYAYPKIFLEAENFHRNVSINIEDVLRKLSSGEIQATLEDELVAQYTSSKLFSDSTLFYYSTEAIDTKHNFFGVSPKTPNFREIIFLCNKALDKMKADGTYDRLLEKHLQVRANKESH